MKKIILTILLFFIAGSFQEAKAKIYIDITQTSKASFNIALSPLFRDGGGDDSLHLGEDFDKTLRNDLELMGVFRFIETSAFLESPKKKALKDTEIDFSSWAVLDALALVKGSFKVSGSRITIEARLFDVLLKKELTGKKYEGSLSQVQWMAHRFADEIMRVLTGQEGLFETKISFVGQQGRNKELFLMDFNGSNVEKLTDHRSLVFSPTWSRDASAIYYTAFGAGRPPQLYRYDIKTKTSLQKTRFPGMVIGIRMDPTANLIATTLTKDGNSEIYLLGLDGTEQARLTRNADIDVSPSFSPDGKEIAFVSNRDGSAQIYKMDRTGENVRRMTFKGGNNTAPSWSPRGNKLLFAGMDTDGKFDIFSMNVDGSGMVRLTYDTKNNEEPCWSPDGQLIVFSSDRTGQYQLWMMQADGSSQMQLTRGDFKHSMPAWGPRLK